MDAGGGADAGRDAGRRDAGGGMDAGPPSDLGTCEMPRMLAGAIGTVMIDGDTTAGPVGRDLGLACGNPEAARFAPTDIIAYTVPGTGAIALDFTMVNAETDMGFDSVIQIRRDCAMIPMGEIIRTCFDDAAGGEVRSGGATTAEGGSTLFFVVGGYAETDVEGATDRGAYRLEVTARQNNLPVVTGGSWNIVGDRARALVTGTDADMEPFAYAVTFQDDAGAAVDLNGDGMVNADDDLALIWDNLADIEGMAEYTGYADVTGLSDAVPALGARLTELMVTQASTRLIDASFGIGEPMTLTVTPATEVGLTVACDAMNVCVYPLFCGTTTMECEAPPAIATACGGATEVTVATPTTTTTTSAVLTGTLGTDRGVFRGNCPEKTTTNTDLAEQLYTVTIPATPAVDLIATTEVAATMTTDTVLYVRSACPDPSSELICDDDIDLGAMNYRSSVEVRDAEPGRYTFFVEQYGPTAEAGAPFGLQVSLRPVLATGAACDPAGVMNRCAMGACPAGTMMCP